ncbi:MAG: hypothetical protein ABSC46_11855 [Candidatus Limnocylindrales bacterium]|jgi:hypothetical protein
MWGRRRGIDLVDTPETDVFFERLDRVTREQLLAMRAAWHSIPSREHEEAWAAVRAVGDRTGLSKEIGRVRNKALAWSSRGLNSVPFFHDDEAGWLQAKGEASEAIVDAALAVALGDRLDAGTRETLLGPWRRATEGLG